MKFWKILIDQPITQEPEDDHYLRSVGSKQDALQYAERWISSQRPNAKILRVEPDPDGERDYREGMRAEFEYGERGTKIRPDLTDVSGEKDFRLLPSAYKNSPDIDHLVSPLLSYDDIIDMSHKAKGLSGPDRQKAIRQLVHMASQMESRLAHHIVSKLINSV